MSSEETIFALCAVSGKPIPKERVQALISLGTPREQWTCVEHSQTKKVRGMYYGLPGVTELKFVKAVQYDGKIDDLPDPPDPS